MVPIFQEVNDKGELWFRPAAGVRTYQRVSLCLGGNLLPCHTPAVLINEHESGRTQGNFIMKRHITFLVSPILGCVAGKVRFLLAHELWA